MFFIIIFFKELVKQFFIVWSFFVEEGSFKWSLTISQYTKINENTLKTSPFCFLWFFISSSWNIPLCDCVSAHLRLCWSLQSTIIIGIESVHCFVYALLVCIYIFYSQTLLCTHKIRYSFSSVCLFCSIFLISHILSGSIFDICYTAQLFSSLFWFFHSFIFCDFLFGLMTVIRKLSRSDRISNFNKSIQSIWIEHKTSWARWSEFHN